MTLPPDDKTSPERSGRDEILERIGQGLAAARTADAGRHAAAAGHVARARDLYEAGLFQEALAAASEALAIEPGNADASAVGAMAEARLRAAADARSLKVRVTGHLERARAHLGAAEWSQASREAQGVLDLEPENAEAYTLLQEIRTGAERAAVLERERLKAAVKRREPPAPAADAPHPGAAGAVEPAPPPRPEPASLTMPTHALSAPPVKRPVARPPVAPTAAPRGRRPSSGLLYAACALLVVAVAAAGYVLFRPSRPGQAVPAQAVAPAPVALPAEAPADPGVVPGSQQPAEPALAAPGATPAPAETPAAAATAAKPRPARAGAPPRRRPDTAADAKGRARDLQQKYARARAALNSGDYAAAIAGLEAVLAVDPNYQDAGQLLQSARGGARSAAQQAVDAGAKAEAGGDYAGAINRYLYALQLDPSSPSAADAMRRTRSRMLVEGEDAFKRGRQYDALGRVNEAVGMYEKALKLLPPEHPNVAAAKERLAALRGGN